MSEIEIEKTSGAKLHWPTFLLGLIVAAIFLTAIFSYQVSATEKAVVMTFGKITGVTGPGIHFRLPKPAQTIVAYDVRLRCFDGNIGKLEETTTNDGKNLVVGIFVLYKIEDLDKFHRSAGNVAFAEERLGSLMRTAKLGVIGKYRFDELVNSDPKKIRLADLEEAILKEIAPEAMQLYGIKVESVGVKTVGVPEKISKEVANRMVKERNVAATRYRESGKAEAAKIRTEADNQKLQTLSDADAAAKKIRAEGDAEAAVHYAAFAENPELASFLRKIESLKRILSTKTTLVLDTDSAPFDIMGKGGVLAPSAAGTAAPAGK